VSGAISSGVAPYVAVVGSGDGGREDEAAALDAGRALGRRGAVLVCGGMGGVMASACRGAREEGGTTVGLLPGLDRNDANPHVEVVVATGLGEARNALVVRAVDAVVAIGGGYGTLSEIGLALKAGTPVVGVATWELSRAGQPVEAIEQAASGEEAVDRALTLARRAR
jgi:uncharacterized protein (TIGR00725 family)